MNDCSAGMAALTSIRLLILQTYTVVVITVILYDYGEQYIRACYSSQTEMRIGILPLDWQSSCFPESYIISFYCSPHLIGWLTMLLKDTIYLGEEANIIKQAPSPLWSHSTDPGLGSPQCMFWCV